LAVYNMFKSGVILAVCLVLVIFLNPTALINARDKEAAPETGLQTVGNFAEVERRMELVTDYSQKAGYPRYFAELSLLWTEDAKQREALQPRVTKVDPWIERSFKDELFKLLWLAPENIPALIWAGNYHYCHKQFETAYWYYRRVVDLAPESAAARLPLADYYLDQWQPEQVIDLLKNYSGPAVSLRLGAAYLQSGCFRLAYGYLRQAQDPALPQTVKKDLLRVKIALGEAVESEQLRDMAESTGIIGDILQYNLNAWLFWATGDYRKARLIWNEGRDAYPDYPFWGICLPWSELETEKNLAVPASFGVTPEIAASLKLLVGEKFLAAQKATEARRFFLEALKDDRRLLVGYLKLGELQAAKKNYDSAIAWLTKGLEINPGFPLFWSKRAEVYLKNGDDLLAKSDREMVRTMADREGDSRIKPDFNWDEKGRAFLTLQGLLKNISGFWLSEDGKAWRFYPWPGGSVMVGKKAEEIWLLPVGAGLTQEFYHVKLSGPISPWQPKTPSVAGDQLLLKLPEAAEMVAERIGVKEPGLTFVAPFPAEIHPAPLRFFGDGPLELRLWYPDRNRNWRSGKIRLDLGETLTGT